MEAYRLKHIPTGLYYKPGSINLSKKGKVYFGKSNRLTYHQGPIVCTVKLNSPMLKQLEAIESIKWGKPRYTDIDAFIPREQFCIEPLI